MQSTDPYATQRCGPTSQPVAITSAEQQDAAFTTDAPRSAAEYTAAHGGSTSGQRGAAD